MEFFKDLLENHLGVVVGIIIAIVAGFLGKKKKLQPVPNEEYTEFSDDTDENNPFFEITDVEKETYLQQNLEIFPKNNTDNLKNDHSEKLKNPQIVSVTSPKTIQNKEDNENIIDLSEENITQAIIYSEIFKHPNY